MNRKIRNIYKILVFVLFTLLFFTQALAQPQSLGTIYRKSKKKKRISLKDCILRAFEVHPQIKSSIYLRESSKAQLTQSKADWFPKITFQSSYNYSDSNTKKANLPNVVIRDSYSSGFSLSQNIYDFGRTHYRVLSAKENLKASSYDILVSADQIIFDIKKAYYQAIAVDKALEVNKKAVEQQELHLKQAKDFFKTGTKAKIEVTKAEVDLANAKLTLIQTQNDIAIARANLSNAIGIPGSFDVELDDDIKIAKVDMNLEKAISYAKKYRPEMLKLKAQESSNIATLKLAKAEYFPIITGSASYRWQDYNMRFRDNYWDLGVQLNYDLFTSGARAARVKETLSNLNALVKQNQRTWQGIYLEVQTSYFDLVKANSKITLLEKSLQNAKENFKLAKGRYEVGLGNSIEFTDAQTALQKAQLDYISAVLDYLVAIAKLEQSTGFSVVEWNLVKRFVDKK